MKPETVGMSSARLARLDEVMKRRYVDSGYLPGMLTQVYRKGQLVHTGICGQMDIERGKPMREDAIFRIYSMIEADHRSRADDAGRGGPDRPRRRPSTATFPAWKNLGVYASGMPSLLADAPPSFHDDAGSAADEGRRPRDPHLRSHLRLHDAHHRRRRLSQGRRWPIVRPPGGLSEMIDQLAQIPLDFSPGTAWNYSVSIDVLGYLVEKLSGMSFGEFLRTRLFEPLGMNDTAF